MASAETYYFELRTSRTGRKRLEFVGNGSELRSDDFGPEHYTANELGISTESIHAFLAVNDDYYNHIGIYGHHDDEDGVDPEAWSEEKKKYENMRYVLREIESKWNEIAETVEYRASQLYTAISAVNDVDF